tara:strand:- start:491 stop:1081 length:591 start_codon:yes stop_codon:yes gene_type:complete
MKTIKKWLCKWLGIDGLTDLTVYNIGQVRDSVNKVRETVAQLEGWCHHTAECHTSNMDRIDEDVELYKHKLNKLMDSNLGETIDKLIEDLRLLKSKQKCDVTMLRKEDSMDINMLGKDIKDNERRIDRLEQCIYGLSISDDVKATDVKGLVKDLAHQMYGERAARDGDDSADYPEDWNYDEYGRPFKYIDDKDLPF